MNRLLLCMKGGTIIPFFLQVCDASCESQNNTLGSAPSIGRRLPLKSSLHSHINEAGVRGYGCYIHPDSFRLCFSFRSISLFCIVYFDVAKRELFQDTRGDAAFSDSDRVLLCACACVCVRFQEGGLAFISSVWQVTWKIESITQ